jgi:hypothetical protein
MAYFDKGGHIGKVRDSLNRWPVKIRRPAALGCGAMRWKRGILRALNCLLMSTLAYASLTTSREAAAPGTSVTASPGVGTYIDAFAALVPAEVLTLHALIISYTVQTRGNATMIIEGDGSLLRFSFWGLIVLSMVLYAGPRLFAKKWDGWDFLRVLIPPLAFAGWTMLQKMTAFDAVYPALGEAVRTVVALFLGVGLGLAAVALAYEVDRK